MFSHYGNARQMVLSTTLIFNLLLTPALGGWVPVMFNPNPPKHPDGPVTYQRAVNLLRDNDLSLLDKSKRDKWEAEWRHKFTEKQLQEDPDSAGKRLAASVGERHTYWMNPAAVKAQQEQIKSSFGGIGCVLKLRDQDQRLEALPKDANDKQQKEATRITGDHPCVVHEIIEDSPSEKAGLKVGDVIVSVDGQTATGIFLEDLINKIRGEPGSSVVVRVERENQGARNTLEFKLVRAVVINKVVKYQELPNGISYLKLRDFMSEHLMKEFPEALLKAGKRQGLILDLRDNGGGMLEYAKQLCQLMIYEGTYLKLRTRMGEDIEEKTFTLLPSGTYEEHKLSSAKHPHLMQPSFVRPACLLPRDFPIVVLINEHSASASEILAGALQTCQRAILVGKRSYGKGVGQNVFHLSHDKDGRSTRMIAVTTFEFRPGNTANNLVGLRVDEEVAAGEGSEDTQLNRAVVVASDLIAKRTVRLREEKDILEKRQEAYRKEMEKKEREAAAQDKATSPDPKK